MYQHKGLKRLWDMLTPIGIPYFKSSTIFVAYSDKRWEGYCEGEESSCDRGRFLKVYIPG